MFKKTKEEILELYNVDPKLGLDDEKYEENILKYGKNKLNEEKKTSIIKMFFSQLQDVMIYVLLIASVITVIAHWPHGFSDAIIILMVVLINAIVGVIQEYKAGKAVEALKKMSSPTVVVRRNGFEKEILAEDLTNGDIVILETGKYIPADIRLLNSVNLKVDESALTGESIPVEKDSNFISKDENLSLGDIKNMCFMSTLITSGRAEAIVVNVGMKTEIGKIAQILIEEDEQDTPLQRKLNRLGKTLGYIAMGICLVIFLIGIIQGKGILDMLIVSISLAVAAIPEGLVAIVAIVLTIGVTKMSKNNAIVKKLPAVETLGSVNVICSDKTGTLTQNKMTVVDKYFTSNEEDNYNCMFLCNDVIEDKDGNKIGDPTEIALYDYVKNNIDISKYKNNVRVDENSFDSDRKLMSTMNEFNNRYKIFVKGAVENLLEICSKIKIGNDIREITNEDKLEILKNVTKMSNKALRVLAFAYKDEVNKIESKDFENDLIFTGFVGMIDPPRESVKASIKQAHESGIKVVMITGDHLDTALAIAKDLNIAKSNNEGITGADINKMTDKEFFENIENYTVFARVSPEHKVKIVKALKAKDKVVSMTGDGVNDAPSLKIADIGVAMGITGTDVSKGASSMILLDDNFSTIVKAIEAGRNIYNNIKKTIMFLLSCNLGEVFCILFATLFGWEVPLLATQILWVNLVTDTLPALSLGVDNDDKDVMSEKPRSINESFFTEGSAVRAVIGGVSIGILTLLAFYIGVKHYSDSIYNASNESLVYGRTMAFIVLTLSQLFYSLTMRNSKKSILQIGIFTNKYLVVAIFVGVILQFMIMAIPSISIMFGVTMLNFIDLDIVIIFSLIPMIINEIVKKIQNNK